jgi:hypothetical protein
MKKNDVLDAFLDLALAYNTSEMFEGVEFHDDVCRTLINLKVLPKNYFDSMEVVYKGKVKVKQ